MIVFSIKVFSQWYQNKENVWTSLHTNRAPQTIASTNEIRPPSPRFEATFISHIIQHYLDNKYLNCLILSYCRETYPLLSIFGTWCNTSTNYNWANNEMGWIMYSAFRRTKLHLKTTIFAPSEWIWCNLWERNTQNKRFRNIQPANLFCGYITICYNASY